MDIIYELKLKKQGMQFHNIKQNSTKNKYQDQRKKEILTVFAAQME